MGNWRRSALGEKVRELGRKGELEVREGELEGRGAVREDKWRRMEQEGRRAGWELKREEAGRENSLLIAGKEGTIGKLGGR